MELAQITAGQVVMLFLLMGTGMLLPPGTWAASCAASRCGSWPLCALVVTLL